MCLRPSRNSISQTMTPPSFSDSALLIVAFGYFEVNVFRTASGSVDSLTVVSALRFVLVVFAALAEFDSFFTVSVCASTIAGSKQMATNVHNDAIIRRFIHYLPERW